MASIQKHGNRYRVVWREGGVQKKKSFATEAEAKAHKTWLEVEAVSRTGLERTILSIRSGKVTPTVAHYAQTVLDASEIQQTTRDSYAYALREIAAKPLGSMEIGKVTPADARAFSASQKVSRRPVHAFLSKVFNAAVIDGTIPASPLKRAQVKPPRQEQKDIVPLNPDELERLAENAPNEQASLAILLGGYVGLRASEVGGIRLSDLNTVRCTINVRQAAKRSTKGRLLGKPKGGPRIVSAPCSLLEAMAEYGRRHPSADGLLFHTEEGKSMTANNFTWPMEVAVRESGIGRAVTFHDLRHACASILISMGYSAKLISEQFGHKDGGKLVSTTYAHLFPNATAAIGTGMESLRPTTGTGRRRRSPTFERLADPTNGGGPDHEPGLLWLAIRRRTQRWGSRTVDPPSSSLWPLSGAERAGLDCRPGRPPRQRGACPRSRAAG